MVRQLALRRNQLAGSSFLNNPAILQYDNFVRFFRERYAMRDEDDRAASERAGKRVGDAAFRNGVKRGGRLVHDENGRVAEKGACQGNALPFASGQRASALADDSVIAFGKRGNEGINGSIPSAGADFVQSGPRFSVGNVFAYGGAEEIGSLLDEGDFTAKIAEPQHSNVVAVDGYGAGIGVVEAKN